MNVCSVDGVCDPQVIFIFQFLVKMLKQNHKRDTWLQATTISNLFLDGDEMHWACSALVTGRPSIAVLLGMGQYK